MSTANVVFLGPVEATRPLMNEAKIPLGSSLIAGGLVEIVNGEWQPHGTADVGGDVYIIDMDTLGQRGLNETLPEGTTHPAFIPQIGASYNMTLGPSFTVTRGMSLTSSGDGLLKPAATDGTSEALFTAEEDVTSSAAGARIKVRYNPTGVNS